MESLTLIEDNQILLFKPYKPLPLLVQQSILKTAKTITTPTSLIDNAVYIRKQFANISYIVTTTAPPVTTLVLLNTLIATLVEYLGSITATSIKKNIDVVMMLLDDFTDTRDLSLLKCTAPAHALFESTPQPPVLVFPWRAGGIKYTANEVYVDFIETLDAILDRTGRVVHAAVRGDVVVQSRLSGMPRLLLSFINSPFSSPVFHDCVDRSTWEKTKSVVFTPPDGKFKLFGFVEFIHRVPVVVGLTVSEKGLDITLDVELGDYQSVAVLCTLTRNIESVQAKTERGNVYWDNSAKQVECFLYTVAVECWELQGRKICIECGCIWNWVLEHSWRASHCFSIHRKEFGGHCRGWIKGASRIIQGIQRVQDVEQEWQGPSEDVLNEFIDYS